MFKTKKDMENFRTIDFVEGCQNQLQVIKDDNYVFAVRMNLKEDITLMLWHTNGSLQIHTDWNRPIEEQLSFQDCQWFEKTVTCNLNELTDLVLRTLMEEVENDLSIYISNTQLV
jgi:hypothetical protein